MNGGIYLTGLGWGSSKWYFGGFYGKPLSFGSIMKLQLSVSLPYFSLLIVWSPVRGYHNDAFNNTTQ